MAVVEQPSTTTQQALRWARPAPDDGSGDGRRTGGPNGSAATAESRLGDLALGHVLITMIGIGHRLGLLDALAAGPGTAADIAARAGVVLRYAEEWLGSLVAGGIAAYDPDPRTFAFAPGYAPLLTGTTAANIAPSAEMQIRLTAMASEVSDRFLDGAGISAAVYAEHAGDSLGGSRQHLYDEQFVDGFLGAVPGLADRLRSGARVLDMGCGPGQVARLVADAFPASRVTGVDVVAEAIDRARAAAGGRPNLDYRVGDAALLAEDGVYDVVTAVDVIHDLARPAQALAGIRRALAPGGIFVMIDVSFSADLAELAGDAGAATAFGVSVLHCLPISLHDGGAGLGAMWGRQRAVEMLRAAGFDRVEVFPSPRRQNAIYLARPSTAVSP
jgi:2-polyprenyl-3-methyl-5-hydroxy-6-metoxy-1,4-benzoquinol methylase